MSSLWHILWPGWQVIVGQIWIGIITAPPLVCVQMWLMRKISSLHKRIEALESPPPSVGRCGETTPDRFSSLGFAVLAPCNLTHGHRGWHRNVDGTEWSPDRPSARSDAFKGW